MVAATAERHDEMMTLTFDGGFIIHGITIYDRRKGNDNTLMVWRYWRWLRGEAELAQLDPQSNTSHDIT